MAPAPKAKRLRAWNGRSPYGCLTCRARGKKCDEWKPWCLNCLKGGKECAYSFPLPAPSTSRQLGRVETETFYKFVHHQSKLLGSFYDIGFWANVVPCVAQGNNQILNATLALATLYEIPTTGTLAVSTNIRRRYQNAIVWYCQSVNSNLNLGSSNQSDIPLLLISTILYLFVELRQIEFQNLTGLTQSAFAVLHASRDKIWTGDNSIVLASLAMLIDVSIHLVDSREIPRIHRLFAIELAMRLVSDSGPAAALYQLRIELASIVYDLHDLVPKSDTDEPILKNDPSIAARIAQWQLALALYRTTANPQLSVQLALDRLEFLSLMCQVRREFVQAADPDYQMIKEALNQNLGLLDHATRFLQRGSNSIPDFTLETGFVVACTVIAWHWRQRYVFERIENILKALPPSAFGMSNFLDRALIYIDTLINTPYSEATEVELILFHEKPKSLLMWQQQRCADYLALQSRGAVS
ncbi:MAG: hypothetical protein GOMPHAMPRED_005052 [Gomphillus americanus]|uniref:Zn(2)-C6 fungal-type domain-containing protein n=1 Tax=Gomphillus americanus TaxID=1940652 RepID=A0A8H3ENB8_9LECA|nr:MAG: hypothetical protein GOMPHAMPRED_005052 [Gomphillus americanus]